MHWDQEGWVGRKKTALLPNGEALAYLDLGNPDGPPLVLVHGFTDSSRSWSLVAPFLADAYRLILPDLRGHGQSSAPGCCYALSDLTYDVRLLLDQLGISRVSLAGHSLGSMVAQAFAQQYPDRLDKMLLLGSAPSAAGAGGPGSWLWDNIQALREPIDPQSEFVKAWYSNPLPVDETFLAHEQAEGIAVPLHVWRGIAREMAVTEFGRLTRGLTVPTLILWGAQDPLFTAEDQTALRALLPQAQFVAFEQAGHNFLWEEPQEVARLIAAFLEGGRA